MTTANHHDAVAIVGMAGRFCGAADVRAFWRRISAGEECLRRLGPDEMRRAGVPEALIDDPRYVPVNGVLEDVEAFDAAFFGMSPRDASITDPQHRVFLELAWHALEDAGHDPARFGGAIGVYAGSGFSTYLLHHLWPNRDALADVGELRLRMGNGQEYLATRTSFALDLRGPSINVNTACSTSLVAVHLACEALLAVQCDLALAGGISIQLPQEKGYRFEEGGILSPDGHCRAFDAAARGTVGGNGGGVVVLKRLADALADRNRIYAVVRSSAINNDGAAKAGYTAPSVEGQRHVIAEAQALSGVAVESIGYVETHGTGTPLGDPIEFAALTAAFRQGTQRRQFCAIGSVKTNVGHLDEAAGVAGLIKTAFALHRRQIPPSLHFREPNPELAYEASPFFVGTALCPWPAPHDGSPRAAGVSSFGIGGTNAHVVLEENEPAPAAPPMRPVQLLPVSARTPESLGRHVEAIADALQEPETNLADVAFTLQVGRRAFPWRQCMVASGSDVARAVRPRRSSADPPPVIVMFSGQGSQHASMTEGLYRHEPVFRASLDACAELLRPQLSRDLRDVLYPASPADREAAAAQLARTEIAQPAIVAIEYALLRLWQHWGVRAAASIGHSLGEYLSAHLAGVMDLETLLSVVVTRARLMQAAKPGAMLAVMAAAARVEALAADCGVDVAAVNAADRCVLAGAVAAIEGCAARLGAEGIASRRLPVSHAFHTAAMEPVLGDLASELGRHALQAPGGRWISNVTGDWIAPDRAVDPAYYAQHARRPVRFEAGIRRLAGEYPGAVFLEVGPGQSLTQLARRSTPAGTTCLASCAAADAAAGDHRTLLASLGELWAGGVEIDWDAFAEAGRQRVSVPGTPFDRERHWIAPGRHAETPAAGRSAPQRTEPARWLHAPAWRRAWPDGSLPAPPGAAGGWLCFIDDGGRGSAVAEELRRRGHGVTTVQAGEAFLRTEPGAYVVRPGDQDDTRALVRELARSEPMPRSVAHFWALDAAASFEAALERGFEAIVQLARELDGHHALADANIAVITQELQRVLGDEAVHPDRAAVFGGMRVIPQEFHGTRCRSVDVDARTSVARLVDELLATDAEPAVALRGAQRWVEAFAPLADAVPVERLRPGGVYLITGGFGTLGLLLAEYLAASVGARLVLTGRRAGAGPAIEARIRQIEALGAAVLPLRADVTDEPAMEAALVEAGRKWGRIDGVFHLAGAGADEAVVAIDALERASRDRVIDAKAHGALVLERLFRSRDPDFICLFSSLASVLGGLGFAAYAAANHVLDALARAHAHDARTEWLSINWDGWQRPGSPNDDPDSIAAAEAPGIFARVLQAPRCGQIVVSTTDLDSRRLRWVAASVRTDGAAPTAPADAPLAERVAAVWREMLGVDRIEADDDFFQLRGDSLVATQLVARVNRHFGAHIALREFLARPTLGAMVEALSAVSGVGERIEPAPLADDYPPTHAQRRLWILCQSPDACAAYNMSYALRVAGALDVERFRLALEDCVARHEILRTAMVLVAGELRQRVLPSCACRVPVLDLRHVADAAAEADRERQAESARAFDLADPPLIRARVIRLADDDHLLLVTLHHIVGDGDSLGVLMRDLHAHYAARAEGRAAGLAPLPVQYKDFAAWMARLPDESLRASREYWLERLHDAEPLELPTDRPWPQVPDYAGDQVVFRLDAGDRRRLADVGQAHGATLFCVLLSTTMIVLHHLTGQDDIVVGTPVSGRARPELADQVGYYLNNVVLRESVRRRDPFPVLLARMKRTVTDALSHQDYPFDRIVEDLGVRASAGRSPLFDVQVNLMPAQASSPRLGELGVTAVPTASRLTMFPINVMFSDGAGGLAAEIEYATSVFERSTIEGLAERLRKLLRAVGEEPRASVRTLCGLLDGRADHRGGAAFVPAAPGMDERA